MRTPILIYHIANFIGLCIMFYIIYAFANGLKYFNYLVQNTSQFLFIGLVFVNIGLRIWARNMDRNLLNPIAADKRLKYFNIGGALLVMISVINYTLIGQLNNTMLFTGFGIQVLSFVLSFFVKQNIKRISNDQILDDIEIE